MRDQKLYLRDILDAINKIEEFVEGMDFEDFKADDKSSSAVVQKFEIIGEAAKNIPDNIRQKHPNVPWKEMSGMRDRLIHSHFRIDYKLVWTAIKNRLPKVKPMIKEILEKG